MKKNILFGGIIFFTSQMIWAVDQTSTSFLSPSLEEERQPVQQFVMSEADSPPVTVKAQPPSTGPPATLPMAINNATNSPATTSAVLPSPETPPGPPLPVVSTAMSPPIISARPLGLVSAESGNMNKPFLGGIDMANFVQCKQIAMAKCRDATSIADFQLCLKQLQVETACQQFLTFAQIISMSSKDDIDVIEYYKEAQLNLIHLRRFGANYPGVYYTIGVSGDFNDLIFGPQIQLLDIQKDPHYASIAAKYPKVQLFSIVDAMPVIQSAPNEKGLRFILRFQLLNGCHACEHAGYANIGYDFDESGTLKATTIVSLDPSYAY